MRLLILGGSFNPVHIGHLIMAQEVRFQFGYDLVLLIPSLRPPHKSLDEDSRRGASSGDAPSRGGRRFGLGNR